jgi:cell wall-associated NlpC family hydrolase
MIFIFTNTIRKIIAITCTAATMLTVIGNSPALFGTEAPTTVITASAESTPAAPTLSKGNIYSNKIGLTVDNISKYSDSVKFKVYVDGNYIKSCSAKTLKSNNSIAIYHNGKTNLKAETSYKIKVCAVSGSNTSKSTSITVKTVSNTYYKIVKSTQMYTLTDGKMKKSSKTSEALYVKGVLCTNNGTRIGGKSYKDYEGTYLLINEGDNKGKYVKVDDSISRITERTAKIKKVIKYAAGMNGGRYVYGGERYGATDCSGLTMLAYKQVGVTLAHSARSQASAGSSSSMSNLKEGDIIICNNYGHAALYIGDGKIVHAMSSRYGIKIQDVSKISYCGKVNTVRTII